MTLEAVLNQRTTKNNPMTAIVTVYVYDTLEIGDKPALMDMWWNYESQGDPETG